MTPARGKPNRDEELTPVVLSRKDRRGLYQLLEAAIPSRLRRIEISVYAVLAATASRELGGVKSALPTPPEALWPPPVETALALARLIFG